MNRREFIGCAGALASGAAAATAVSGCASHRYMTGVWEGADVVVPIAGFELDPSAVVEVPGLDRPLFVHRHPDGRYTAVTTRCAHQGCQVQPSGQQLECPCHGSRYTLGGGLLQGPADRPLRSFALRRVGDSLHIRVDEVVRR